MLHADDDHMGVVNLGVTASFRKPRLTSCSGKILKHPKCTYCMFDVQTRQK